MVFPTSETWSTRVGEAWRRVVIGWGHLEAVARARDNGKATPLALRRARAALLDIRRRVDRLLELIGQ